MCGQVDHPVIPGAAAKNRLAAPSGRAPAELVAEILADTGPMLAGAEVAERLGVAEAEVEARRTRGGLLAIPVWGAPAYPAFQFVGGKVAPGLEPLLASFADLDPWATLDALVARDEALGGGSLADALQAGEAGRIDRAIRPESGDSSS